jgi:4'-phosphopantetheinyl transferase
MLELRTDEIHVWLAFHAADPHPARREEYGALLSAPEREREARLRFDQDKFRFRVTRAMTRRVLAGYLGIDPSDCGFENNPHGRPSLVARGGSNTLSFNLSHTRDLIVLAVTRGREIGVDVERVHGQRPTADLARHYFADFESDHVVNAPEYLREDLFFQYWTLKESYIKARGLGLAIPLGKFGFRLGGESPQLWTDADLGDDAARWAFVQWQPTDAHWAAICVERTAGGVPSVRTRDFATLVLASPHAPA